MPEKEIPREWWWKLAEQISGHEITETDAVKDAVAKSLSFSEKAPEEKVLVPDLLASHEFLFGLRLTYKVLRAVWDNAPDEMTMKQLVRADHIMSALDQFMWQPYRVQFPKADGLGIRRFGGKLVLVEFEDKEEKEHPSGIPGGFFQIPF